MTTHTEGIVVIDPDSEYKVNGQVLVDYRAMRRAISSSSVLCVVEMISEWGELRLCGESEFEEIHHDQTGHHEPILRVMIDPTEFSFEA